VPTEALASYDTREGFEQHRAWEATLAEGGWSSVIWPKELGGRGCDLIEWLIFEEEYYARRRADARQPERHSAARPTLMEFGTPEQKARFLPRMARCDDMWAQGWSEPNAGSDMARSPAGPRVRDGDHYVINGQKTWSTRALFANWLFGLFRSDPQSSRHHGLSYLLVPWTPRASPSGRSRP
jgi:alkylation response protein AidB-like acyl-CoA dehydrogenase